MKRRIIALSVFLLLALNILAQGLSPKDSLSVRFFKSNFPAQSGSLDLLQIDTSFTYRNLTFYNFSTPKGFVILRDLGSKYDVVGYDYNDNFSFEADTTGFLKVLANALVTANESAGYAPEKIHALKTGRYAIEPLIKTLWNQGWPYNYLCPVDPGVAEQNNRTLVGCVAVAMAQIIRYWDKWNDWSIYYSYTHATYGLLTCNAGNYNWGVMENSCYSINTEVAMLLSDCGILVNMGYSRTGSGAQSADAAKRFNEMYKTGYLNTTLQNEEEFFNNISNYQPIYATYPGHAFVCDGYDGNGFYHFNLGWGGSSNGYYSLSSVVGKALTSAIFNVYPVLANKPPRKLQKSAVEGGKVQISWTGPDQDRTGLTGYKIYLDDKYLTDSQDTTFTHDCVFGDHYVKVSAQFASGESRWIGPVSYYFEGNPITIPDATLKRALNTAIGISSSQVNTHVPTEGELCKITRLNVTNAASLSGLDHCPNLTQLYLYSTTTTKTLDMEQIMLCTDLAILTVEKYILQNPVALANLKKLNELRLVNNKLTDPEFLKSLTLITRLEIVDNSISDPAFLNSMPRVEWLTLKNCNISDFSVLENTYGFRTVDVSFNHLTSLDWINKNRSLQTLNAASNSITGTVALSDLSILLTIDLTNNTISNFQLTGSPTAESLYLGNNSLTDIQQLLSDNPDLGTLSVHHNKIAVLPDLAPKLTKLELNYNLIKDISSITRYTYLTYLNLSSNQIVDIQDLIENDYHTKLTYLNLQSNPIGKESFTEIIPVIKASGITSNLPSQYHPGSPCYLGPVNDKTLINKNVHFEWQADFNNEGYKYRVFLSRESEPYAEMAASDTNRFLDYQFTQTGKYSWYVISEKDSLALQSRINSFKIMQGFAIPFIDDFELYTANSALCAQSPYWRINDVAQDPNKDAFINTTRAFDGNQSLKISGTVDIIFPVSEYLQGSSSIEMKVMVEKSRKAYIQATLSNKTAINLYFYSEGVVDLYSDATFIKTLSYKSREWLTVSVNFTDPSAYKVMIDNVVAAEGTIVNTAPSGLNSIRLGTLDGPGYHASAPTVFYVDNFAVKSGMLLSDDSRILTPEFPGLITVQQGNIHITNIDTSIKQIRVFSIDGRLLYDQHFLYENPGDLFIRTAGKGNMLIIQLYDNQGRAFTCKVVQ
jgi:Leucine-rich repeat (LRR) protein